MKFSLVIVGAGSGTRLNQPVRKALVPFRGRPMILATLLRFAGFAELRRVVLVVHPDDHDSLEEDLRGADYADLNVSIIGGGAERQLSVLAGLSELSHPEETVLVHDAARPLVTGAEISAVLTALETADSAFPAVPIASTVRRISSDNLAIQSVDRTGLVAALTPQGAKNKVLCEALEAACAESRSVTDEIDAIEGIGQTAVAVAGSIQNMKITSPDDLVFANKLAEMEEASSS